LSSTREALATPGVSPNPFNIVSRVPSPASPAMCQTQARTTLCSSLSVPRTCETEVRTQRTQQASATHGNIHQKKSFTIHLRRTRTETTKVRRCSRLSRFLTNPSRRCQIAHHIIPGKRQKRLALDRRRLTAIGRPPQMVVDPATASSYGSATHVAANTFCHAFAADQLRRREHLF